MALLKKIRAFTLIESLVSGIMISALSGIAMVVYLNVAASLSSTRDILMRTKARNQMDSLASIPGIFELSYEFGQEQQVFFEKSIYKTDSNLLLVSYEIVDTLNLSHVRLNRLQYE